MVSSNQNKLAALRCLYPQRIQLRAPSEAIATSLYAQAAGAARLADLDARVETPTSGRECSVPLWDELRTWDPGD